MCESKAFFYKFPSIHLAKPCLESVFTINFTLESNERVKKIKKERPDSFYYPVFFESRRRNLSILKSCIYANCINTNYLHQK